MGLWKTRIVKEREPIVRAYGSKAKSYSNSLGKSGLLSLCPENLSETELKKNGLQTLTMAEGHVWVCVL